MAVSLRVAQVPAGSESETPEKQSRIPAALAAPTQAYLARLAALHDEAAETAYLANLLGRAPWAAGAIGAAALVTALCASASPVALGIWLALVAIGIAAIGRNYAMAIEAPFERASLDGFARNLSAIMLYAGTAWGAGLLLVAPAGALPALLFMLAAAAPAGAILRARDVTLCFVVPATGMGLFCALMGGAQLAMMGAVILAGLAVAGGTSLIGRIAVPASRLQPG
jgi:hypothetical protein